MRRPRLRARPAVVAAAALVCAAAATAGLGGLLALKAFLTRNSYVNGRPYLERQYFRRDERLGWVRPPNLHVLAAPGGRPFFTTNRDGFRGPEFPASGEVLLVGDSMVEGYFLADEETMPSRLAAELRGFVYDLGVGGYSPDQYYIVAVDALRRFRVRWVVVCLYANDLLYHEEGKAWGLSKPRFRISAERVDFSRLIPARWPGGIPDYPAPPPAVTECCWPVSFAAALGFACDRYGELLAHPFAVLERARRQRLTPGVELHRAAAYDDPRAFAREWDLTFQFMEGIRKAAAAHGARVLVVYLPEALQTLNEPRWGGDAPQRAFLDGCKARGFECLDPLARFREEQRRGASLHFLDDGHLSPRGAALAARLIAERLRIAK